jgi:hypothetical protein
MLKKRILQLCATCLLMFALCLIVGCNKKEETSTSAEPAQSSAPPAVSAQPPAPAAAPPADSAGVPSPATAAPPSGPAPPASSQAAPAALASTEGELPGITVTVQELKRSSTTVTLKLMYINHSSTDLSFYGAFGSNDLDYVHLIDLSGKKKYFVVKDSSGQCLCSNALNQLPAGSQKPLWAKFPPIPDDVKKITIEMPRFPPLEDVPIS